MLSQSRRAESRVEVPGFSLLAPYVEWILARQPPRVVAVLTEAAHLGNFCQPLLEQVLGVSDGGLVLRRLAQTPVMIEPVAAEDGWFAFHPLVGDVLRRRPGISRERLLEVHTRAADWHLHQNRRSSALPHLLACGDVARAAGVCAASPVTSWAIRSIAASLPTALTPREQDVLELVSRGASNQSIAKALAISHATVKGHVHRICRKLGTTNRTGAAARARALRLIA